MRMMGLSRFYSGKPGHSAAPLGIMLRINPAGQRINIFFERLWRS